MNIIQSKKIWLSDVEKSNDPQEGALITNEIFSYDRREYWNNKYGEDRVNDLIDIIQNYFCEIRIYSGFRAYAFCLSKNGDLLSQWRGYTNNASGLSIGFNEEYLDKWRYQNEGRYVAQYAEIAYEINKEMIEDIVDQLFILSSDVKVTDGEFNPASQNLFKNPFYNYLEKIAQIEYCFKDKAFQEEQEKRMILREYYHHDNNNYEEYLREDLEKSNLSEIGFEISSTKFRVINSGIKNYYEICFERIKDDFVKEIIIGPNCEASEEDVKLLLFHMGYTINDCNISIRRSDIIYR